MSFAVKVYNIPDTMKEEDVRHQFSQVCPGVLSIEISGGGCAVVELHSHAAQIQFMSYFQKLRNNIVIYKRQEPETNLAKDT